MSFCKPADSRFQVQGARGAFWPVKNRATWYLGVSELLLQPPESRDSLPKCLRSVVCPHCVATRPVSISTTPKTRLRLTPCGAAWEYCGLSISGQGKLSPPQANLNAGPEGQRESLLVHNRFQRGQKQASHSNLTCLVLLGHSSIGLFVAHARDRSQSIFSVSLCVCVCVYT